MISFEYFILFLVISLVLIIDKFFSKKIEKINGELVFVSDDKKKNYFGFKKSNIVYWFPLIFIILGLFINDNINLIIYNSTGFIYESLIAWFVIFYYVTFFSYKSLIIVKTKNKIIATEILYFFTIVLLAITIHFSASYKQDSDNIFNRFVTNTISSTKEKRCFNTRDCDFNDDLSEGVLNFCLPAVDEEDCSVEIDTISSRDYIEIIKINDYRGNIPGIKVSVTKTTKYVYDYQKPLISIKWNRKVKLDGGSIFEFPTYFMPFLVNLFIIGYVWRFIFYALFWSLNILLNE